ncbi:MAG: NfeD family protein [Acutalibacteraceae bacterium]|nr:NfeD family protein [Acutalibacteraceae bacterium]
MESLSLALFWVCIAILAAILEGCTVQLVSIWFAVGAVASAITAIFTDNLLIQLIVFLVVAIICLAVTHPLAKRFKNRHGDVATNCDRYIGKVAEVIVDVNNLESVGQVKVQGSIWSAKSTTDDVLPVGTKVKVNAIEGVKMVVTPVSVS